MVLFVLNSLLCIFFACISFLVHWLLSVSAALLCFLFSCCFGAAFAVCLFSLFLFCCCFSNANFLTQFRFFLFRFEDFFLPCSKVGYSTCVLISYFFLGGGGGWEDGVWVQNGSVSRVMGSEMLHTLARQRFWLCLVRMANVPSRQMTTRHSFPGWCQILE